MEARTLTATPPSPPVVYGRTETEHDKNLHQLMKVNEKCHIKKKSISFFGMTYTNQGVKLDPAEVEGIQAMPPPLNKKELQKFLGLITYLSPFVQNLSQKSLVLRCLLKQDVDFQLDVNHQACFDALKQEVKTASTLQYFDVKKPVVLHVDASLHGLGAALLQDGKPVAYASKSLSDVKKRYACIERELLAIVFGTNRFQTYLYGRQLKVLTDHKPLVMISQKNLSSAPLRLQRLLLKLQEYDYTLEYLKGSEMTIADTLSRLPNEKESQTIDLDIRVDHVKFSIDRVEYSCRYKSRPNAAGIDKHSPHWMAQFHPRPST